MITDSQRSNSVEIMIRWASILMQFYIYYLRQVPLSFSATDIVGESDISIAYQFLNFHLKFLIQVEIHITKAKQIVSDLR